MLSGHTLPFWTSVHQRIHINFVLFYDYSLNEKEKIIIIKKYITFQNNNKEIHQRSEHDQKKSKYIDGEIGLLHILNH